jgi:anti-sigma factor RsiW
MVSETDLEILEAYLDDELSAGEVVRLDQRLALEPALAAALQAQRSARAVRGALFKTLEPDDALADRVAEDVFAAVRRRAWNRRIIRLAKVAGAVAASIVIGFTVGWVGRGRGPQASVIAEFPHPAKSEGHIVAHSPKPGDAAQTYQVALTDEEGNIVAVQKFNRVEDARQFADDLGQFEARRQQVEEGRPMLISDRF